MEEPVIIDSLVAPKHKYIDIVVRGSTGTHVASYSRFSGWNCSCPFGTFRTKSLGKFCKHLKLLSDRMLYDVDKILAGEEKLSLRVNSSLKNVDALFDGPAYNSNEIFLLYGNSQIGKTLLCLQEAYYFARNGLNVLYIDTEGGVEELMRTKFPKFKERFGEKQAKIYLQSRCKSVESLANYFGYDVLVTFKQSKKDADGKLQFDVMNHWKPSDLEKDIKENNINVIILDSMTAPLHIFTASKRQNFTARRDCAALLLRTLVYVQEHYDTLVIATNHASSDPTNPYETKARMAGGQVLHYYGKRILYMDKREKKDLRDYRRIWMKRGEDAEWSKVAVVKITDYGYFDVTDEREAKAVLTQTEGKDTTIT